MQLWNVGSIFLGLSEDKKKCFKRENDGEGNGNFLIIFHCQGIVIKIGLDNIGFPDSNSL